MKWARRKRRVHRLVELIAMRATGSPTRLADRLEVSESTLFRDLQWVREQGYALQYNYEKGTYEFADRRRFVTRCLDNKAMKTPEQPVSGC